MHQRAEIDVGETLEATKLGRFHLITVGLCALVVVVDGLDFGAGNVAAPAILKAFSAQRSEMGLVFGWMYFGILLGSLLFGYIGDRFGRRPGLIIGVLTYTLPALAAAYAGSMQELMVLRFITGLGIGGVIPNTIALATENAPKRYRASLVIIVFVGYAAGSATIAQVAARFIPTQGWPVVFLVAGVVGIVLSLVLAACLPESIRWLALNKPQSAALRVQMRRLAPQIETGPETRFVLRQESRAGSFSPRLLFAGNRSVATPLLWLAYFAEALTFMTLLSWLPLLMVQAGLSQSDAALTLSYGSMGGIAVMVSLARPLDKWGPMATVAGAITVIAALVAMGTQGLTAATMMALAVAATMCGTGTHNSLNGTVGIFYPTAIRGNGVGYATGMGRIASIIGPTLTGFLLSAKLPLHDMLYLMAAPYVVVVFACIALGLLYKRRFAAGVVDTAPLVVAPEGGA
ncbi:MAG TPA: MFS transporter [Stellaceae bacterium]|nr:MFS transporter [Stellaceae bacterium]